MNAAVMMVLSSEGGMTTQPLMLHQLCTVFPVAAGKKALENRKEANYNTTPYDHRRIQ
jgi:hypothetical protein